MANLNICIIGDGGWGTTLAIHLARKGFKTRLWGAFPDYINVLKETRENIKFLPGVKIPEGVSITASLDEAAEAADLMILAVPSQHMRGVATRLKIYDLKNALFVNCAKGIENESLKRMSEVVQEVLKPKGQAVLSGPTIALEVVNCVPTTIVSASADLIVARRVQDIFMTDSLRVYTNTDVTGVELGGALKNIVAIAAGICDGLGFGTNAKAALLTRGLAEMVRLGEAMGAKRETFYGLSGLGDLTTTCISQYSRNRWFGEEIGRLKRLNEVLKGTEMAIEGIATTKSAFGLSKKHKVDMPITEEIYKVLYENKNPRVAVHDLMTRSPKME